MKYQFEVRLEINFELTKEDFDLINEAILNNPESKFEAQHGQWWYGQTNSFNWYHAEKAIDLTINTEPHFVSGTFRQVDKHIMKSLERLGQQLAHHPNQDQKDKSNRCFKLFGKFMSLLNLANDRYAEINKTSVIKEI